MKEKEIKEFVKNYLNHIQQVEEGLLKIILAIDLYELLIFKQIKRETIINLFMEFELYKHIDFNLMETFLTYEVKRKHRAEINDFLLDVKSEVRNLKIVDILIKTPTN